MIPIKKKHRSYRSGLLLCVAFLLLSVPTLWFMWSMHGSNIATTIPFFQGNHHRAPRPPCKVMIHVITTSTGVVCSSYMSERTLKNKSRTLLEAVIAVMKAKQAVNSRYLVRGKGHGLTGAMVGKEPSQRL